MTFGLRGLLGIVRVGPELVAAALVAKYLGLLAAGRWSGEAAHFTLASASKQTASQAGFDHSEDEKRDIEP